MKKLICKLSMILSFVMILSFAILVDHTDIYAADLSSSVSDTNLTTGDGVSVKVTCPDGYTATVKITYDTSIFDYVSGGTKVEDGVVKCNLGIQGVMSTTLNLKSKKAGSGSIVVTPEKMADANTFTLVTGLQGKTYSMTVKDPVYVASGNNKLSSLSLSAGSLSPEFDSDVANYTAEVENSVESVEVYTKLANGNASIDTISGNKNLQVGENYIKIVVVAENGNERAYNITLKRLKEGQEVGAPEAEEGDVKFTLGDETYISVKEAIPETPAPPMFEGTLITISDKEYPCLRNETSGLVLMYLFPEGKRDGSLYYYNVDTKEIAPFSFLSHGDVYIAPLPEMYVTEIPKGYVATTITLKNGTEITAYALSEANAEERFYLLYCLNTAGEFDWYQFDVMEETFQKYVFEEESDVESTENGDTEVTEPVASNPTDAQRIRFLKILLCGAIGIIFLLIIILIVVASMKRKTDLLDDEDEDQEVDEEEDDDAEADNDDEADEELDDDVIYEAIEEVTEEEETLEDISQEEPAEEEPVEEEPQSEEPQEKEIQREETDEDDYKKGYVDSDEEGDFTFIDL